MAEAENPRAVAGNNRGDLDDAVGKQIRSVLERVERLEENKKQVAEDIKDVFAEAKGQGFDVKVLRELLKIRKQDKDKRDEFEALLDLYGRAAGIFG